METYKPSIYRKTEPKSNYRIEMQSRASSIQQQNREVCTWQKEASDRVREGMKESAYEGGVLGFGE